MPRACAMAFLSRLDPTNQQHQRLMEELVMLLLKKVKRQEKTLSSESKTPAG